MLQYELIFVSRNTSCVMKCGDAEMRRCNHKSFKGVVICRSRSLRSIFYKIDYDYDKNDFAMYNDKLSFNYVVFERFMPPSPG